MRKYGLFSALFSQLSLELGENKQNLTNQFLEHALKNMDERIRINKSVNPAFLFAVFLWFPLQRLQQKYQKQNMKLFPAFYSAMDVVVKEQLKDVAIPRRFIGMMEEIWLLQFHLVGLKKRSIMRIFRHQRFRAAYDFLLLRASIDPKLMAAAEWWTHFQELDEEARLQMMQQL
jgi:poly(A) polymerase